MNFKAYDKFLIGFILIFININIGPFDIFPDTMGYILILGGLYEASRDVKIFSKGIVPSSILIIVSLGEFFIFPRASNFSLSNISQVNYIYIFVLQLIRVYLVFCIFRGTYEMCRLKNNQNLMKSVDFTNTSYIIFSSINTIIISFCINFCSYLQGFFMFSAIFNFMVMLFSTIVMSKSRRFLQELNSK